MSDEKALLAAIAAHPLDDAPRLVYADWLDEHPDDPPAPSRRAPKAKAGANAARAELIRVQCEQALLPPSDPRYGALEARAAKLLVGHRKEWAGGLKGWQGVRFWRGFPLPRLELPLVALVQLGADDLRAAPLWLYAHGADGYTLDRLLDWPQLHRLTTFTLRPPEPNGWAQRIAECPGLRNVTELGLSAILTKPGDLKRVLDAWTDRRLGALLLNDSTVGDAGARVLARHPAAAGLRSLWAHSAELTSRGVRTIVGSPYLENLTVATFAHNPLGDAGGRHLLRWKALPHLRELYLMNTGLSADVQAKFRAVLGARVRL